MTAAEIQAKLKRKFPPAGKFMFIDNVWMHYVELLPENYHHESHKTVVCIHGLSGSVYDFLMSPLIDALKNRYRIICIDRPGAGYSYITDNRQYTLEMQIDIIKKLLHMLQVKNPVMVGHSLGGALVLNFAALNTDFEAKYLLLAPLIYPVALMYFPLLFLLRVQFIRLLFFRLILCVQSMFFHLLIRNAFRPNADLLQPQYEALTRDQLSSWHQLKSEFNNLLTVKQSLLKNEPLYKKIKKPLVILAGKNDKIIPVASQAEKLRCANPDIQVKLFSRVGHMVNFALHRQIADEIDRMCTS
jgi:pimeloyl-ACP methyl ester carboxylesterase